MPTGNAHIRRTVEPPGERAAAAGGKRAEARRDWRVIAASCAGGHGDAYGATGQDAWGAVTVTTGVLVLCAADGAGSAPHGGIGAATAVGAALQVAQRQLEVPPADEAAMLAALERILLDARHALECAAGPATAIDAFATTFLLAAHAPGVLGSAQVGDGGIVAADATGSVFRLTRPQVGEHAGETVFLSSDSWREHASVGAGSDHCTLSVALLTDGLDSVAFEGRTEAPFKPFFGPLFAFAADEERDPAKACLLLTDFLTSERIEERCADDRTLLIAVRNRLADPTGEGRW